MTAGGQKGRAASWTRTASPSIAARPARTESARSAPPVMNSPTSRPSSAVCRELFLSRRRPRPASIARPDDGSATSTAQRSTGLPPAGEIAWAFRRPGVRPCRRRRSGRWCSSARALPLYGRSCKAAPPMSVLKPINVGPVRIDSPVILAPMTGVTDLPFRRDGQALRRRSDGQRDDRQPGDDPRDAAVASEKRCGTRPRSRCRCNWQAASRG